MDAMLAALAAPGPDPDHAGELETFGQFVGSWDVDLSHRAPDGAIERLRGEWHFGWALGGRAIVDVWHVPGREHGVAVRFYDPAIRAWRVCWSGPVVGRQILFVARRQADEIVLEGEEDGSLLRWIFSEITENAFRWRALISGDGGESWQLAQEMAVTRRAGRRDVTA